MENRRRVTVAILLSAIALGSAFGWFKWRESRRFFDTRALLSRFPVEESAVLSIDFSTLRLAGLLGRQAAPLEPEYRKFVEGTGFDYRHDLDTVIASIAPSGNYFIARGRFDWQRLRDYAKQQGGGCYDQLCRMTGSTPERRISFVPLRDDVIALAVSTDDLAAAKLTKAGPAVSAEIPKAPVWLSVPGAALRRQNALPSGVGLMLSGLANADRIVITIGASATGIEAQMEASCRTPADARVLASQLKVTTSTLKQALQQDRQAANDGLAQLLTSGSFDQNDRKVLGKWPLNKNLLQNLTAGI